MMPFVHFQIRVRELFHRDLLSARFYVRRARKNGPLREIVSFLQTKTPYALPLPKLPYVIGVEPTNRCNLRCIMCPSPALKAPRGFMSMSLYQKIVREAESLGTHRIRFVGLGEPLLHPELPAMIRMAKQAGLYTEVSTNATLLTRELGQALLDAGLDEIGFSLDSADAAEYERIRLGADFKDVIGRVEEFLDLCAARAHKKPITVARMVVMDASNVEAFKKRWATRVDSLQFNVMRLYKGSDVAKRSKRALSLLRQAGETSGAELSERREREFGEPFGASSKAGDGRASVPSTSFVGQRERSCRRIDSADDDAGVLGFAYVERVKAAIRSAQQAAGRPLQRRARCRLIMGHMPICWDGRVSLCNQSSLIVGDANTTPLEEIWRGLVLQEVRRLHARHEGHLIDVCRVCPVMAPALSHAGEPPKEADVTVRRYFQEGERHIGAEGDERRTAGVSAIQLR